MKNRFSIYTVGHATSLFLVFSYSICIVFDLLFPEHAMYEAWQKLLPGFKWISWKSFIIGFLETYAYGWYFAVIWVPLYNYFYSRTEKSK